METQSNGYLLGNKEKKAKDRKHEINPLSTKRFRCRMQYNQKKAGRVADVLNCIMQA